MYILATLLLLTSMAYFRLTRLQPQILPKAFRSEPQERVLIVTAHPDDECMFFAPTILALTRAGIEVHVLCLSRGNHDGLGEIRAKELQASCTTLGIRPEHCQALEDPQLQDHPTDLWTPQAVAAAVYAYLAPRSLTKVSSSHGLSTPRDLGRERERGRSG